MLYGLGVSVVEGPCHVTFGLVVRQCVPVICGFVEVFMTSISICEEVGTYWGVGCAV